MGGGSDLACGFGADADSPSTALAALVAHRAIQSVMAGFGLPGMVLIMISLDFPSHQGATSLDIRAHRKSDLRNRYSIMLSLPAAVTSGTQSRRCFSARSPRFHRDHTARTPAETH